jgi:hypothetical protein
MKGGFTKEQLGEEQLEKIANTLEAALNAENGVIGFGMNTRNVDASNVYSTIRRS